MSKQIAISIIGYLLLILWYFSFKLSCYSLIIFFIINIFVFKASFEYSAARRLCFANCYFKKDSFFFKIFTKKIIIYIINFIKGLVLTSIIMLSMTVFSITDFIILFFDIFIIFRLYNFFIKFDSLNQNIKNPIIKNGTAIVNAIFIMLTFLIINLYQTPPQYIQNDLLITVHSASNQLCSLCPITDALIRLTNEIVAVKWWLMLDITINVDNKYYLKEIVWFFYLLGSYLMAFAYGRYILEFGILFTSLIRRDIDERKR